MRFALLSLVVLALAGEARAHIGATVSKATFANPPEPSAQPTDGGLVLSPYTFASGDAKYTVQWTVDFPTDPTGKFDFYYMDHTPPSLVTYDQVVVIASPVPEASGDNAYWVSCDCNPDAGVVCPDAGPRTHCSQYQFDWDTSALPSGAYWLIAANLDPPYKVYSVSPGPIRVAHGGASPPPAAVVVLPDGLFATDQSYTTVWLAAGQPPLHFDVSYGFNTEDHVMDPPILLGQDITPIVNPDKSFSYIWDTSKLDNGLYYFSVKVTDATGQSTYTDSWLGENVYHPPQDGGLVIIEDAAPPVSADMAVPDMTLVLKNAPSSGCSCEMGAGTQAAPLAAGLFAAALLVVLLRRRRG